MSENLLAKLRAARESWIEGFEGREYLFRRPTMLSMARLADADNGAYLRECLVGWRGVKKLHLVPGGTGEDAPFDADLCIEWLEDRPSEMSKLVNDSIALISAHAASMGDAEKK
jgi:hypothetical protein